MQMFPESLEVYEIDIGRYENLAQIYGILTVPTLVSGTYTMTGIPSSLDLQSFLLQSFTANSCEDNSPYRMITKARVKNQKKRLKENFDTPYA